MLTSEEVERFWVRVTTPNKSARKRPLEDVTLAVIHYTGARKPEGSVEWFKNPEAKVSAHFIIGRDGKTWCFGEYDEILWHAGVSQWQGRNSCNSFSIGYELTGVWGEAFEPAQYEALRKLLADARSKCPNLKDCTGHEHISPGRKVDPGPLFSWREIDSEKWNFLGSENRTYLPPVIVAEEEEPVMAPGNEEKLEEVKKEEVKEVKRRPWWRRWCR